MAPALKIVSSRSKREVRIAFHLNGDLTSSKDSDLALAFRTLLASSIEAEPEKTVTDTSNGTFTSITGRETDRVIWDLPSAPDQPEQPIVQTEGRCLERLQDETLNIDFSQGIA
jgi:hypothetical protein